MTKTRWTCTGGGDCKNTCCEIITTEDLENDYPRVHCPLDIFVYPPFHSIEELKD